ncbi:MAG: hypothetical protein BV459_06120 [Thermoplasmata archaeon M11B2D]|nr:MAG: hypothetical protein BV459_06120 [Thermoplasmata archaeon M11B2D]PNX53220.1 MAG: hypothetical protein BV458_05620 [Thermoplasmata archaeon M9B2D]
MRKLDDVAQAGQMILLMLLLFVMIFIFGNESIRSVVALSLNTVFAPIIGFGGANPLLTIMLAGIIVVFLSSFFTHVFTDWKAMGQAQEASKAFNKEITKARREGNTNRVQKLMKMQPQIMRMTTQSSGGMMKSMFFLFIFIAPIFIWLTYFLGSIVYYQYFTVPWGTGVSLFGRDGFLMSNWFFLYMLFSFLAGQLIRQSFKWISWSSWWQNIRKTIRPSAK